MNWLRADVGGLISRGHRGDQPLGIVMRTDNLCFAIPGRAIDQPGANGVDIARIRNIQPRRLAGIFSQTFGQVPDAGDRQIARKA